MVVGILGTLIGGAAISLLDNLGIRKSRAIFALDPVKTMDFAAYCDAFRLKAINKSQFYRYSRELGYSPHQAKLGYNNFRQFISGEQAAVKRIADSLDTVLTKHQGTSKNPSNPGSNALILKQYQKHMFKQGYGAEEAETIFNALRPVPTFSILLEWLAKECFEPEIIKKFKLDADYPVIWKELMAALKVPANEAKNYWIAHWVHPAPGQMAEMFHRLDARRTDYSTSDLADVGVSWESVKMDKSDFIEGLKLQEIAPYWHDKLLATSYQPLTLTALQQGYVFGLKTDDWFVGRLRDYGLSEDNAKFTMNVWRRKFPYGSKSPKSENAILLYQRGEIESDAAIAMLVANKVPADAASFVVGVVTDKRNFEVEAKEITGIAKKYRKQAMSRQELIALATSAGVDPSRVDRVADIVEAEKEGLLTRLKIRDVKAGVKNKNLTIAEAKEILQSIRIDDSDIAWLIQIYTPKKDIPIA